MIKLIDFYKTLNYKNPVLVYDYNDERLYQNKGRKNLLGCKYEYEDEDKFLADYGEKIIRDFYYTNKRNMMIIKIER